MNYVSPIKIGYEAEPEEGWTDKIGKYLAGEVDNLVLQSCVKVGCHVDKDELEKALRYDRGQYEKGYEDGKRDAAAAIEELQARLGEAENSVDNYKRMWLEKHEPKTARWEGWTSTHWSKRCDSNGDPIYTEHTYYQCSYCGRRTVVRENFCPNCGAVMEDMCEVHDV